jgi:hypothetical protein
MSEVFSIDYIIEDIPLTDYLTINQINFIINNYGSSLKVYIIDAYYNVYYDIFNDCINFSLM